jgi:hypothetical protein
VFLGAYWFQRKEDEEAATSRIVSFVTFLARTSDDLKTWYALGRTAKAARRKPPLILDHSGVLSHMTRNRRDDNREVIEDLGWSFNVWNGGSVSLSCRVGMYSPRLGTRAPNCVLLSFGPASVAPSRETQEAILREMICQFDPDHAVATSHKALEAAGAERPWEVGSWLYHRGEGLKSRDVEL